jgi:hypothetical protein
MLLRKSQRDELEYPSQVGKTIFLFDLAENRARGEVRVRYQEEISVQVRVDLYCMLVRSTVGTAGRCVRRREPPIAGVAVLHRHHPLPRRRRRHGRAS